MMHPKLEKMYTQITQTLRAVPDRLGDIVPIELLLELGYKVNVKAAAQTLKSAALKFEGLYDPVYRLIQTQAMQNTILKEWNVRANYLFPGSDLDKLTQLCYESSWASKMPQLAAKLLLKCIQYADIVREPLGEDMKLKLTPLQASAYRSLNGEPVYADETVNVITAAWYGSGQVV